MSYTPAFTPAAKAWAAYTDAQVSARMAGRKAKREGFPPDLVDAWADAEARTDRLLQEYLGLAFPERNVSE